MRFCTISDTDQETIGLLTYLGIPRVMFSQMPVSTPVLFSAGTLRRQSSLTCSTAWDCSDPGQDLALDLAAVHVLALAHVSSLSMSLCKALLDLQQINTPTHLVSFENLTEGALCLFIQITDQGIKQSWTQYWAVGNSSGNWLSTGCSAIHSHSLGVTNQTVTEWTCTCSSYGLQLLQEKFK